MFEFGEGLDLDVFLKKNLIWSEIFVHSLPKNTKTDVNLLNLVLKVSLWVIKQEILNFGGHIC
jgi:hypothetical protein